MNPLLARLQPYPFERLRQLFTGITPNPAYRPISLGIGEPKHATPEFIKQALTAALDGLAVYPATAGAPLLREACATWLQTRYGFIRLPEEMYYISKAEVILEWWQVLAVDIGTFVICFLVLMIPTMIIRRVQPVKAIQFR